MRPCSEVTLAVVYPVTPAAIRSASSRATLAPASLSSSAVVIPVMPAPMTATSTSTLVGSFWPT
jgi:hypothetical protein